jgi:parallel beta-helix repeat protein
MSLRSSERGKKDMRTPGKRMKCTVLSMMLLAVLLTSMTHIFPNASATEESYGDWFIGSGTVKKSNVLIHLYGDLIINTTARLIFEENVTLRVYSNYSGEHYIQVNGSGEFHVLNKSTIESNVQGQGYKFLVYGTLNVQNESTVKWMWGDSTGSDGGIQMYSGSDSTIENSTITQGETHNLYLTGNATAIVKNSNITYAGRSADGYGILAIDTSAPLIENNNISNNNPYGVGVTSTSSIEISYNNIWGNANGIEAYQNTLLNIHNNTVYENSGYGIRMDGSASGTKVRDNTIYSTNTPSGQGNYVAGIYVAHATPQIEHNSIKHYTSWADGAGGVVCFGASPTISDNLFQHNARGLFVLRNGTMKSSPIVKYNSFTNNFAGIIYATDSTTTSSQVKYNNFTVLSNDVGIKLINLYAASPFIMYNNLVGQYYPHSPPYDEKRWGIINSYSSPWIEQNTFTNFNRSIDNTNSNPTIKSNTIVGDGSTESIGIRNYQSSPSISGNNIKNNSYAGIYFEGLSASSVSVNTIESNNHGVYLDSSSPSFTNNTIKTNLKGVYAQQSSSSTLSTNTIKDNTYYGIDARSSSPLSIMNNDILRNQYGVLTWYNSDATIQGNVIKKNSAAGISVAQSSPNIQSNDILDNDVSGIDCQYGGPTILYNTIKSNAYAGIVLKYCTWEIGHNTISDTRMHGSYNWVGMGIFVSNQSNPKIHNNTIKDNAGDGIYLSDINNASHPSIRDNTFENNSKWAIHMRWTKAANTDAFLNSSNTFLGNQSLGRILQEWYLVVHVTDDNGTTDIEGAFVNITESPYSGPHVWEGQTGSGGKTDKITLTEYYYDNNGKKHIVTPHRVRAEAWVGGVKKLGIEHPWMTHNYGDYIVELEP